jgi:phage shock protein PspC (stress-responsive transcriptional regulator)
MDDRLLAGVASGLGSYFNVDPVVFRVGFVALTLAGGVGLLIYLLCWVLLPPSFGPQGVPAGGQIALAVPVTLRQGGWKTYLAIGAVLFALALLFSPFTRPTVVFALLLIALGVLLLVQDQPGGERPPSVPPGQAGGWTPPPPPAGGSPPGQPAPPGQWQQPAWSQPSGWGQPTAAQPPAMVPGWGSSPTAVAERAPRPRSVIVWVTVAAALLAAGVAGALDNFGVVNMTVTTTLALMLTVVGVGLLVASVWGRGVWLILLGCLLLPVVAVSGVLDNVSVRGDTGDQRWEPRALAEVRPEYATAAGGLRIDLSQVQFGSQPTTITGRVGFGELRVIVPNGQPVTVHAQTTGSIQVLGRETNGYRIESETSDGSSERLGRLTLNLRVAVGSIIVERGP